MNYWERLNYTCFALSAHNIMYLKAKKSKLPDIDPFISYAIHDDGKSYNIIFNVLVKASFQEIPTYTDDACLPHSFRRLH